MPNTTQRAGERRAIFLCHASKDKDSFVIPVAHELHRRGISYWLDEAEIRWGDKIAQQVNRALNGARFVVIFLTESFVGRGWTEAELSAALTRENAEGRTVVLVIVAGNETELLRNYVFLRDKKYARWSDGVHAIVSQLEDLLFISEVQPKLEVPIGKTGFNSRIGPDRILEFLDELDPHTVFAPNFICEELERCGFLASWIKTTREIDINGLRCAVVQPDVGEPGIWSLALAAVIFQVVTGEAYTAKRLGRGRNYRVLLRELREFFISATTERNPDEPSSRGNDVATGRFHTGVELAEMAAKKIGAEIRWGTLPGEPEGSDGTVTSRWNRRAGTKRRRGPAGR